MRSGLEGVVVADTVLSLVDPPNGRLWIRGVALPELLAGHGYEGTVALLWEGFAGDRLTRAGMQAALGAARHAAFARLGTWLPVASSHPLEAGVRLGLAMLPDDSTPAGIAATLAVGVPALLRAAAGQAPVPPDPSLPVAADLLRMLHGRQPEAAAARALDTYFTAMADSGMSPSSFTARVVASTRASVASAVLGAWCAFSGPLHGGAPGPTLDLVDALAATGDMDAWIERKLRAGERLMGFGHRVYRGNDPRAAAMRAALRDMGPAAGRLEFAAQVEACVAAAVERVKPGRKLPANVEIMAALLLDAVGIPRNAFTPVFAVGRCASWIAHALEQQRTGRMFRPESRYVGPAVG
ncbi:MAG TPA: citrate synthase [Acetobacteraceae bacterium]|nr:citrate synthase [Acetobacteraceae bacterium]